LQLVSKGMIDYIVICVSKGMMDYIVICFWIAGFNIGMKLDLVVMVCRLLL